MMIQTRIFLTAAALWVACLCPVSTQAASASPQKPIAAKRYLLAHYLPWYAAKPYSAQWGWHWTMGRFNPDLMINGQPEIAAHAHPLIGPYDSGDPEALECQILLMKMAGIDGVVIDWYGSDNFLDYQTIDANTRRLIPLLAQAGLHFAVCYEDQSVPKEIAGGVFPEADALAHGQRAMQEMQVHFFSSPAAISLDGRPLLLSFGTPYYQNAQWAQMFAVLPQKPLYLTETVNREPGSASGAFDWPLPGGGTAAALAAQLGFCQTAGQWPLAAATVFPRFHDIYAEAGVGKSYGEIDDNDGRTYAATLTAALQSPARIVQIATWNDWGEGTQIEPSREFGMRDLLATQRLRRRYWGNGSSATTRDFQLPIDWYLLCKKYAGNPRVHTKLAAFFPLMTSGHQEQAQRLVSAFLQDKHGPQTP